MRAASRWTISMVLMSWILYGSQAGSVYSSRASVRQAVGCSFSVMIAMVYITTHKVKSSGSVGSHDTNMFLIAEVRGDSETQIVVQVKD